MPVDDAAVRDLGLDMEHSPNLTELRLPSRISCLAAFGLGFDRIVVRLVHGDRRPDGHGRTAVVDRPGHRVVDRGCPALRALPSRLESCATA